MPSCLEGAVVSAFLDWVQGHGVGLAVREHHQVSELGVFIPSGDDGGVLIGSTGPLAPRVGWYNTRIPTPIWFLAMW